MRLPPLRVEPTSTRTKPRDRLLHLDHAERPQGSPSRSRSSACPYTSHAIDISKDEQFQPDFLKIAPNNRIPAIVDRDNGMSLMESGAILIYLADKTGKLLAREGEKRYRAIEWLMWQMGGPGPMLGQVASLRGSTTRARRPTPRNAT
jgi:glutathione S-transferase